MKELRVDFLCLSLMAFLVTKLFNLLCLFSIFLGSVYTCIYSVYDWSMRDEQAEQSPSPTAAPALA